MCVCVSGEWGEGASVCVCVCVCPGRGGGASRGSFGLDKIMLRALVWSRLRGSICEIDSIDSRQELYWQIIII